MWKQIGVGGKMNQMKNFFKHPCDSQGKVYMFSDVPQLFKSIRNRLHKQKYLKSHGAWMNWSMLLCTEKTAQMAATRRCARKSHVATFTLRTWTGCA